MLSHLRQKYGMLIGTYTVLNESQTPKYGAITDFAKQQKSSVNTMYQYLKQLSEYI